MIISERIFQYLEERHMSQAEFCRRTGIATSTVNDWRIKKTNPSVDKIMAICRVLEMKPEELLREEDTEITSPEDMSTDYVLLPGDRQILIEYHNFTPNQQKRLLSYMKRIRKGTDDGKKGEKS